MNAKAFAELLTAIASLAWPVFGFLVVLKMLPFAKGLFTRDKVKIKIGELELSAEEATETISSQIKDLQAKLVQLEKRYAEHPNDKAFPPTESPKVFEKKHSERILWVDDVPANNAIQIDFLRTNGFEVWLARSTAEGMSQFESGSKIDLVITDLGRWENSKYVPNAGIILTHQIRSKDKTIPIIIFTSPNAAEKCADDAKTARASAITSSPVDLYLFIQKFLKKA